ncbi:hypothetical protein QEN19_003892 [Hanseniaspora menglaensis]
MRSRNYTNRNSDNDSNSNFHFITNAASKAITNTKKNSLYQKEIFEFKDCNKLLTYQSVHLLRAARETVSSIIVSFESNDLENSESIVMISSVVSNLICSFDFNNSKILKKRMQLLVSNKLIKMNDIFENDSNDFSLNLSSFSMPNVDDFDEYKKKFYNKEYQLKLLKSCLKVVENELYLIEKKNKLINSKFNDDSTAKIEKYCHSLCTFDKFYELLPQLAIFVEDIDSESTQEHHMSLGIQFIDNISKKIEGIFKTNIEEYINKDIFSFKDESYLLHKIYFVLLVELRYIDLLSNIMKQFYKTNILLLANPMFAKKVSNLEDFENMMKNIEFLDSRLLIPCTKLVDSFCVEYSMLVNQSKQVILGLIEKYLEPLHTQFHKLNTLISDFITVLSDLKDVTDIKNENTESEKSNSKTGRYLKAYFDLANINNDNHQLSIKNDSNDSFFFGKSGKVNSFDLKNKKNQIYRTASDVGQKNDISRLNSKLSKPASALSDFNSLSSLSSRQNSMNKQSNQTLQNLHSNSNTATTDTPKKAGHTLDIVVSSSSSSTTSSTGTIVNSLTKKSTKFKNTVNEKTCSNETLPLKARSGYSTLNGSENRNIVTRSRASSVNEKRSSQTTGKPRSLSFGNNRGIKKLENSVKNLTVTQDTNEENYTYQKVRFTGVPNYPMKNEDAQPTRQGWYSKPAVLHYPLLPSSLTTNLTTVKQSPFNKLKQMEGFAFKHSNDLIKH